MTSQRVNPYNWKTQRPLVHVPRTTLLLEAAENLLAGEGAYILGGHGMGKSVFLHDLADKLSVDPQVKVLLLSEPPVPKTLDGALAEMAGRLGVAAAPGRRASEIIAGFFSANQQVKSLVLLFDELDQYTHVAEGEPLARMLINMLEAARNHVLNHHLGTLGILVAGGLAIFDLRERYVLGSPFLFRAQELRLTPFSLEEQRQLAIPLIKHGGEMSADTFQGLNLASGGNPALLTYGLHELWKGPMEQELAEIFARFKTKHPHFIKSFQDSLSRPGFSGAPFKIWQRIRTGGGSIPRKDLDSLLGDAGGLGLEEVLRLLCAAGLITIEEPLTADPVRAWLWPSILNLPEPTRSLDSLKEQFYEDLRHLLAHLHSLSPGFFRDDRSRRNSRQLVWEANFSTVLALGFRALGWFAEREAASGAGYSDLILRHGRFGAQKAIVELKVWENWGDEKRASWQGQVEHYWDGDTVTAALVTLTARCDPRWPQAYAEACLNDPRLQVTPQEPFPPLCGHFSVRVQTQNNLSATIEHLLIQLPR